MNKKIEEAIKLRIGFGDFFKRAQEIDNTIATIEFKHYPINEGTIENFGCWAEWRKVADHFKDIKEKIPKKDYNEEMPIVVKETRLKVKELLKKTIEEAIAEIIICDFNGNNIRVTLDGVKVTSMNSKFFLYGKRYKIPQEVVNILNSDGMYRIWDEKLLNAGLTEFVQEFMCDEELKKYFDFNEGSIILKIEN